MPDILAHGVYIRVKLEVNITRVKSVRAIADGERTVQLE